MSWLRLDDGFVAHPKLVHLNDRDFRTWVRVLCWCARYQTRGVIPARATDEISGLTPAFVKLARRLNLLEEHPDSLGIVHDWDLYNGSIEERVANYLDGHPEASANDVCRAINGKRSLVLALVAQFRTGSQSGTPTVPQVVPPAGSKSGSRARGPLPLPKSKSETEVSSDCSDSERSEPPQGPADSLTLAGSRSPASDNGQEPEGITYADHLAATQAAPADKNLETNEQRIERLNGQATEELASPEAERRRQLAARTAKKAREEQKPWASSSFVT